MCTVLLVSGKRAGKVCGRSGRDGICSMHKRRRDCAAKIRKAALAKAAIAASIGSGNVGRSSIGALSTVAPAVPAVVAPERLPVLPPMTLRAIILPDDAPEDRLG